jgi:glycerol-3-phosphate dehydrogenase (NAD(P)+)
VPDRPRPQLPSPLRGVGFQAPFGRRAVVVGAGSFGTAVAVLLARGGLRTTLQARTREQAERLAADRENAVYLPGVELPRELRVEAADAGLARAEFVFLGVPSHGLDAVIAGLVEWGPRPRSSVVSLSKGLVPPTGRAPTVVLREHFGPERVACIGGPAHAREMVHEGAGLVAASEDEALALQLARVFIHAGVVCEESNDPLGVELAGAAKNAAALAAGATERQGLNAAGAAAGHIFAEVWRYAEAQGARADSMIGLAGTGDLVATALAPQSRNRRAGELLADGVAAEEIPQRIGQAVEALESVPLLAEAIERAGFEAPVTGGLARLIAADLPLDDWVALVRTTVPPPARFRRVPARPRPRWWARLRERLGWRRGARLEIESGDSLPGGS